MPVNQLDIIKFRITPKIIMQAALFFAYSDVKSLLLMGGFPVCVYLERPLFLPAGPGLSPYNFCYMCGFCESFPYKKWLLSRMYCLGEIVDRLHSVEIGKSIAPLLSLHDLSEALLLICVLCLCMKLILFFF